MHANEFCGKLKKIKIRVYRETETDALLVQSKKKLKAIFFKTTYDYYYHQNLFVQTQFLSNYFKTNSQDTKKFINYVKLKLASRAF